MKVTVTHNNWAKETQGYWDIHFENRTSGWAGDGLCKVEGTATLNSEKLIDRLSSEGLIDKVIANAIIFYLSHKSMGMTFQMAIQYASQNTFVSITQGKVDKTAATLNLIAEFCQKHQRKVTKSSYSFCDAFVGGNQSSFHSAKKKVMNELHLASSESIYLQLKSFLSYRKAI